VDSVFVEHVPEHPLDHIADAALGIGNTDVKGHRGDAVQALPCIVPHQDVPDLWPVAVGDYQIVSLLDQENKVFNGFGSILLLLLDGPPFIFPEQGITPQGGDG